MTLRFDGLSAGLWDRSRSGDMNDPVNYMLICPCGLDLGPLARFRPNPDGKRAARCMACDTVVLVQGTSVVGTCKGREVDEKKKIDQAVREDV